MVFLCSFLVGLRTYYYVNYIADSPQVKIRQKLSIQSDSVKVDGDMLKFIGKIKKKKYLVYYSLTSHEEKGLWLQQKTPNTVIIDGKTENFDTARNLNGFDERKHYRSLGFSQKLHIDSMVLLENRRSTLSDFRHQLILRIDQSYSRRLASYIKALVLGYKDEQFAEYSSVYKTTGLLHLFTLSGLHIQFYLGGIHLVFKRLGFVRESRLVILSLIGILLIMLTGGSYSTIRAVISFLLAFACVTFDWLLSKLDQWSVMLFLLVLCFPLAIWSVGAQLSLYFALMLLYLNDLSVKSWQQMLLFSAVTIPVLLHSFSEWTIAGSVFTLLLFPVFEWLILPGCILLFLGCFFPIPPLIAVLFEWLFQSLETLLGFVSFPNLIIGRPNGLILVILVVLVLLLIDRLIYHQSIRLFVLLALILLSMISFSGRGMVAFIDVGQGDSIFIKLPFKQETFLIDTGGRLSFERKKWQRRQEKHLSDYNLIPFLKSVGCAKIDHLLVTHNDADHMGELIHLMNKVKVKNLYLAKGSQMELKEMLLSFKETAIHLVKQGDVIGNHLTLRVLSPEISQGENDDSLVTFFTVNRQRFLLTGDLEKSGEKKLIEQYPTLKTDFLKIGHHGSNTSTDPEFLKHLQPKYAIISAGKKNRYGHPTEETLEKLRNEQIKTYRTDQNGMVYYQWSPLTKKEEVKVLIDFLD